MESTASFIYEFKNLEKRIIIWRHRFVVKDRQSCMMMQNSKTAQGPIVTKWAFMVTMTNFIGA